MFPFLFPLLLSFIASWALTTIVRKRLLSRAVMDIPNERSMHTVPVPRGGGLAVMLVIVAGLVTSFFFNEQQATSSLFLLAGVALLMTVSWLDDKGGLSVRVRLASHLLAATIGSCVLGHEALLFGGAVPLWLDRLFIILGWAWFMNLYNFMDGIDGITGVESISCSAGALLLACVLYEAPPVDSLVPALVIGSSLGFLMLNWHPAKIFLGDVGSVPLGFLTGFLLLQLACAGHLAAALLLPLYYLADSGLTILKRLLRGEKIWKAHREHFYQRATVGEKTPVPVVLWIALTNCGLTGCALLAINNPWLGLCLGVGMVVLLLAKMSHSANKTALQ